ARCKKQLEQADLTITTSCSDEVHGPERRYRLMLRRILIPALAALLVTTPALAQRGNRDGDSQRGSFQRNSGFPSSQWDSEERAPQREVSLNAVRRELQARYGGQMLDAQKMGDRYIISWITQDGRRLTIEVDATSGRVISTR
ncbi:MAG: hypothetical protein ABL956_10695, partial [Hyphomonadaceae bacterium]